MTDRYQLAAYIATLVALVLVFISVLAASALVPQIVGKMEVFGLGTITGGLIGILRIPTSPQRSAANVGTADSVTVTQPQQGPSA